MNELEPLIPYLKEISATLGKHVGKRLGDVLKHFGTDITKYPKRMIERKDAEATAKSEVRIALIQTVTQNVAENPNLDPEFVKHVLAQGLGWTFEEVVNFNKIVGDTTESLLNNPPEDDVNSDQPTEDISKDWLNEFRGIACKKSSEDAQNLFTKVLDGEIRKPGSISLRSLSTLADMDQNVAELFQRFCSLCLVNLDNPKIYHHTQSKSNFKIKDARIPYLTESITDISMLFGNKKQSISKLSNMSKSIYNSFGLNHNTLKSLSEYGLIEASLETAGYIEYSNFWYNNDLWACLKPDAHSPQSLEDLQSMPISGFGLTSVGRELFYIIELQSPSQYWELLTNYLQELYSIKLFKYPKSHQFIKEITPGT